jgi:hypothetical protein
VLVVYTSFHVTDPPIILVRTHNVGSGETGRATFPDKNTSFTVWAGAPHFH